MTLLVIVEQASSMSDSVCSETGEEEITAGFAAPSSWFSYCTGECVGRLVGVYSFYKIPTERTLITDNSVEELASPLSECPGPDDGSTGYP